MDVNIRQVPHALFMVRPGAFGYNSMAAVSNVFQQVPDMPAGEVHRRAMEEFSLMVDVLESHDIEVFTGEDTPDPPKPDAIFPNNWISFHADGRVVLYPLQAENRRAERNTYFIDSLKDKFEITQILDFSFLEQENLFTEGTGSLVFDYVNRLAYACHSPRTQEKAARMICDALGFTLLMFHAEDERFTPVYHTNVVMSIGEHFAVVCLDAIHREEDQEMVLDHLGKSGRKVVAISYAQMRSFAGNIYEVANLHGEHFVLISDRAYKSLLPGQLKVLSRHAELLPVAVPCIEKYGGGSVRCMVAGIFNPPCRSKSSQ